MFINSETIVTYTLFDGTPFVMPVQTTSNVVTVKLIDIFIPILKCKNNDVVTITIQNTSGIDLKCLFIKDYLAPKETYKENSLTINGIITSNKNPTKGIKITKLKVNDLLYISYKILNPNPQVTNCIVSYQYDNQKRTEHFALINNQKTIRF